MGVRRGGKCFRGFKVSSKSEVDLGSLGWESLELEFSVTGIAQSADDLEKY